MPPIIVQGPDGQKFGFPEGTPDATMDSALRQHYGKASGDPAPQKDVGYGEAALQGVGRGLTLEGGDEIDAALHSLPGLLPDWVPGKAAAVKGKSVSELYNQQLDRNRARIKTAEEQYPVTTMAGQVAGGVGGAMAFPTAIGGAALLRGGLGAGALGRAAAVGGTYGGVAGFNAGEGGEGTLLEQTKRRAGSALAGIPGGVAGGLIGQGVGAGIAKVLGRREQIPGVAERQALADKFDTPISKAQATGRASEFAWERGAGQGNVGGQAQNTMQAFDEAQAKALRAAEQKMADDAAGRPLAPLADRGIADEASRKALSAVRAKEKQMQAVYRSRYEKAKELGGEFNSDAVHQLPNYINDEISRAPGMAQIELSPQTEQFLGRLYRSIDNIPRNSSVKRTDRFGDWTDTKTSTVNFKLIEDHRASLNARITAAQPRSPELIQLNAAKRAIDNWTNDTVLAGLTTGGDAAVRETQRARSAYKAYARLFREQAGKHDKVGPLMELLSQKEDLSSEGVASLIYGTDMLGKGTEARAIVRRLKAVIGGKEEWSALQAGGFQRLFQPEKKGGQVTLKVLEDRIARYLRAPFAKELHTRDQLHTLSQYLQHIRNLQTPEGAVKGGRAGLPWRAALRSSAGSVGAASGAALGSVIPGLGTIAGAGLGSLMGAGAMNMRGALRAAAHTKGGGYPSSRPGRLSITVTPGAQLGADQTSSLVR